MKQTGKGILCIITSAFFFALMNLFVRLSGDLPSMQKSFFRNLVAFFIALVMLKRQNIHFSGDRKNLGYLFIRAGAGTIGIICNYYAIDHLALADASMLNKMSPFFAVAFSFLFLKEKIRPAQILIILGAFVGSLFVIRPNVSGMETVPALIGLLGGACAGLAYTFVRILGERKEKGPFIVCFFSGFSCLAVLPFLIRDFVPMTWIQLFFLLGAGAAATVGQFSITAAYLYAPAREISVYDYSQIPFAALLGYLVLGQIPDSFSWIGYLVICGMAVLMFLYNNGFFKKKKYL